MVFQYNTVLVLDQSVTGLKEQECIQKCVICLLAESGSELLENLCFHLYKMTL